MDRARRSDDELSARRIQGKIHLLVLDDLQSGSCHRQLGLSILPLTSMLLLIKS